MSFVHRLLVLSLVAGAIAGGAIAAANMNIKPGKWAFTMTSKMPMMPQGMTFTTEHCLTDEQFDPALFNNPQNISKDDCEMRNVVFSATGASWEVTCKTPDGTVSGKGTVNGNNEQFSGKVLLDMQMQGMAMTMEQTWSAKWVGSCQP